MLYPVILLEIPQKKLLDELETLKLFPMPSEYVQGALRTLKWLLDKNEMSCSELLGVEKI